MGGFLLKVILSYLYQREEGDIGSPIERVEPNELLAKNFRDISVCNSRFGKKQILTTRKRLKYDSLAFLNFLKLESVEINAVFADVGNLLGFLWIPSHFSVH